MYPKAMSQFVRISRPNFHLDPEPSEGFWSFYDSVGLSP